MAVVLSVVVAGASVALFFRKDASQFKFWQKGSDDPFGRRVERRVSTDVGWTGRSPSSKSASRGEHALHVPTAATAAISEPRGLGPDSQPRFQRNLNPVGALLPPIEGIVGEYEPETPDDLNSPVDRPFAPVGGSPRHVVVDGDTLSKLAARYLGRAEDYLAIYEFNRDVLPSPDLLPIGLVLKIPPQRGRQVAKETTGIAPVGGEPEPERPLKMVLPRGSPGGTVP